ncbi:signal peptidase I [Leifsonia sp. NPDC058248]|uniref:signal peptidase I n=1 Tax=Leifsonia sp. NPDC058248 TaxID=3346402 RepID=UPI0036DD9610
MDDTADGTAKERVRGAKGGWKRVVRDTVVVFVVAVLASMAIKGFVIRSFYIPSASMNGTLQVNDRVVVNQLEPRLVQVSRGDVIVFSDPGAWLPRKVDDSGRNALEGALHWVGVETGLVPPDSDQYLIKRVIGLPGDRVKCCNAVGQISVNGSALKEPYLQLPPGETAASGVRFDVTVPEESVWVMGDNRFASADSRAHAQTPSKGFVPYPNIVGRAFAITWPLARISWLDNHGSVFAEAGRSLRPRMRLAAFY